MIEDAVAAIRAGEVVGIPTDTVYGLGADPEDPDAVEMLFALKDRPDHKPIGVLVADIEQAVGVAMIEGEALTLARRNWPGPLTLVAPLRVAMADWVGDRGRGTIGVRVPDHPVALALLADTGPLAVTSANVSGGAETMTDIEARAVFGDRVRVYLEGVSPGGEASTVLDVTGGSMTVLREGPIII